MKQRFDMNDASEVMMAEREMGKGIKQRLDPIYIVNVYQRKEHVCQLAFNDERGAEDYADVYRESKDILYRVQVKKQEVIV